ERSPLLRSSVETASAAGPPDCFRNEKPVQYSCTNLQQCIYNKYTRSSSCSSISPTWIRLVVTVQPGCTNLGLGPRSDHKGNPMFVHPGCTNPGLRRLRETSRKLRARESTGTVTDLRLLWRYRRRLHSLFIRLMSNSLLCPAGERRVQGQQEIPLR